MFTWEVKVIKGYVKCFNKKNSSWQIATLEPRRNLGRARLISQSFVGSLTGRQYRFIFCFLTPVPQTDRQKDR